MKLPAIPAHSASFDILFGELGIAAGSIGADEFSDGAGAVLETPGVLAQRVDVEDLLTHG